MKFLLDAEIVALLGDYKFVEGGRSGVSVGR